MCFVHSVVLYVQGSIQNHVKVGITVSPRRPRVLPSLRYVEIERPFKGDALEFGDATSGLLTCELTKPQETNLTLG